MGVIGQAVACRGELGIMLGGGETGTHDLHLGHEIDEVFDGRVVLFQPHRVRQCQAQTEGKFGLREPAAEVMPPQPARDCLRRRINGEDALPRDEHVVEPHLAVELVVAGGQRPGIRVAVAGRSLAAQNGDARGVDRNDESYRVPVDFESSHRTDIHILGIGWARMHAEPAAHHHALVVLAHPFDGDPVPGIGPHALAMTGAPPQKVKNRPLRAIVSR